MSIRTHVLETHRSSHRLATHALRRTISKLCSCVRVLFKTSACSANGNLFVKSQTFNRLMEMHDLNFRVRVRHNQFIILYRLCCPGVCCLCIYVKCNGIPAATLSI